MIFVMVVSPTWPWMVRYEVEHGAVGKPISEAMRAAESMGFRCEVDPMWAREYFAGSIEGSRFDVGESTGATLGAECVRTDFEGCVNSSQWTVLLWVRDNTVQGATGFTEHLGVDL